MMSGFNPHWKTSKRPYSYGFPVMPPKGAWHPSEESSSHGEISCFFYFPFFSCFSSSVQVQMHNLKHCSCTCALTKKTEKNPKVKFSPKFGHFLRNGGHPCFCILTCPNGMVYTLNLEINFFNLRYTLLGTITHPTKYFRAILRESRPHFKLLISNFNVLYTWLGTITNPYKIIFRHFERERTPF